jgi:hypothetical protein
MNINPDVETLLAEKQHPMDAEIRRVREIILADDRISEAVKWKSPTFMYKGNIASYFLNAKSHVSLMFHKGATIPDPLNLLEGDGKESRVARFTDLADIEAKKEALEAVIAEWIQLRDD